MTADHRLEAISALAPAAPGGPGRPAGQVTHPGLGPDEQPAVHRGEQGLCPAPECRASDAVALAVTVQQPWSDAIAHSDKRCENRTWPIPPKHVGARVLIHAALAADERAVIPAGRARQRPYWPDVRGAVVATARLASCHQATTRGLLCCAPWGFPSVWHWRLEDVRALARPIEARGAQKLWRPSTGLVAAVLAQQAAAPTGPAVVGPLAAVSTSVTAETPEAVAGPVTAACAREV